MRRNSRQYPMNGPSLRVQRDYYEGRITGPQFADYCARIRAGQPKDQAEAEAIR